MAFLYHLTHVYSLLTLVMVASYPPPGYSWCLSNQVCVICVTCISCISCVRCIAVEARAASGEIRGERRSLPKRSLDSAPGISFSLFHRLIVDAPVRRSVLRWTAQLPYPCMRESTASHVTIIAYRQAINFFSLALFEWRFALAFTFEPHTLFYATSYFLWPLWHVQTM